MLPSQLRLFPDSVKPDQVVAASFLQYRVREGDVRPVSRKIEFLPVSQFAMFVSFCSGGEGG